MINPPRIIITLLALYALITTCNNYSDSAESAGTANQENTVLREKDKIDSVDNEKVKRNKDFIPFETANWYKASGKEEIFKGLNSCLMKGVLQNYINTSHADPNKDSLIIKDSISIDMDNQEFDFNRKTESRYSLYDIEYQVLKYGNSSYRSSEELSAKELAKIDKEVQNKLKNINTGWKKIKTYDNYHISGKFKILKVENDSITIAIEGIIERVDAVTSHQYGGAVSGITGGNLFSDEIKIDLAEAFNATGTIEYFDHPDLQIVNNQSLKYLRNQFFARHGYIFKTELMKNYFSTKPWYTPQYDDVSQFMTKAEKQNAELIKQVEDEIK